MAEMERKKRTARRAIRLGKGSLARLRGFGRGGNALVIYIVEGVEGER